MPLFQPKASPMEKKNFKTILPSRFLEIVFFQKNFLKLILDILTSFSPVECNTMPGK